MNVVAARPEPTGTIVAMNEATTTQAFGFTN
jgi:hypothetical protein